MLEIGSSLREARRRQGLELADVEKSIRIRTQQLEALELERFDLLPPDPYRRSFLREYAEYLGLDGDIYTCEYERRLTPAEPVALTPPPPWNVRKAHVPGRRALRAGGVVALVVLLAISAWQLARSGGHRSVASTSAPLTNALRHGPPARHHAAAGQTHASAKPILVLAAVRGSCWLWIRVGSKAGPTIFQKTMQQGQTLRLGLHQRLWIRMGAPWNVDARLGRRLVTRALPSATGNVLASDAGLRPAP